MGGHREGGATLIAKPAPGHVWALGVQQPGDAPAGLPGGAPKDLAGEAAAEAEMNCRGPRLGAPKTERARFGVGCAEGEQMAFERASRKRGMAGARLSGPGREEGLGQRRGGEEQGGEGDDLIEGFGHKEQRYQEARVCCGRGQCPLEANQRPSSLRCGVGVVMFVTKCGCQTQEGRIRGRHQPLPCRSPVAPITHRATSQRLAGHPRLRVVFSQPPCLASRPLQLTTLLGISTATRAFAPLFPLPGVPVLHTSTWLRPPAPALGPPPPGSLPDLACRVSHSPE